MKRSLVLSAVKYQSDHESWSGCRSSALVIAPTGGVVVCDDSTNSSDGATDEDSTAISAASSP